jgi:hypothetical protein
MAPAIRAAQKKHRRKEWEHSYPIQVDLEYRLISEDQTCTTGAGRTISISSRSILFEAETVLPVGMVVELGLIWPIHLDLKVGLKLQVLASIVRVEGKSALVKILRHEFRTRRRSDQAHDKPALFTKTPAMAAFEVDPVVQFLHHSDAGIEAVRATPNVPVQETRPFRAHEFHP